MLTTEVQGDSNLSILEIDDTGTNSDFILKVPKYEVSCEPVTRGFVKLVGGVGVPEVNDIGVIRPNVDAEDPSAKELMVFTRSATVIKELEENPTKFDKTMIFVISNIEKYS